MSVDYCHIRMPKSRPYLLQELAAAPACTHHRKESHAYQQVPLQSGATRGHYCKRVVCMSNLTLRALRAWDHGPHFWAEDFTISKHISFLFNVMSHDIHIIIPHRSRRINN